MKSPFPGMDPFIEACGLWEDFHDALIQGIKDDLSDRVPEQYLVRTSERGYLALADAEGERFHHFKPDVGVTTERPASANQDAGTAVAEPETEDGPFSMRAFIAEEFRENFVEVYEGENLVTCIEVLSPTNKKPKSQGWDLYQRKRQALFLGHVANFVEIDLLRGGERMPMADAWRTNSPYRLLVARRQWMPDCKVWPAYSLRALPSIPIPLAPPDADVMLDLQRFIDAIYARARYSRSIDYAKAMTPALTIPEQAWLNERLPKSGP